MIKIAMALVSIGITTSASADWQGDLQIKSARGDMAGTVQAKRPQMRMNLDKGKMPMSIIVNWKTRHAQILMHSQKMVMDSDMSRVNTEVPHCDGDDIDACFVKQGFKKVGSDTANGHPCTVYEKDKATSNGVPSRMKIWRPTDLKEVPLVKSVANEGAEAAAETNFTNIKVVAQADSVFAIPAGYQKMGDPTKMMGMDPAKMREMFKGMKPPAKSGQ